MNVVRFDPVFMNHVKVCSYIVWYSLTYFDHCLQPGINLYSNV